MVGVSETPWFKPTDESVMFLSRALLSGLLSVQGYTGPFCKYKRY